MLFAGFGLGAVINWIANFRIYRDGERHGILGEHTATLTPEFVQERTPVNDTKAAWRGIFRIGATSQHLFIYTQPGAALVIPRAAFPSPEDSERFLVTARTYYNISQKNA